jgi:hypothetical protein
VPRSLGTHRRRVATAIVALTLATAVGAPALAASTSPGASSSAVPSPGPAPGSFGDQVVLLGRVVVPRGQSVGEVVVFSGRAVVEGIVRGDVVVVDGPITVSGQVSGSVVALGGSVRLLSSAQVGGDVLAHDHVIVAAGAVVDGRASEGVAFDLSRPLRSLEAFVSWLAVAVSTLVLGLLFALVAPRALDRTAEAGRTAFWTSVGWGMAFAIGLPVLAVAGIVLVLGTPLGLAILLSLLLLALVGAVATAHAIGRALVHEERGVTVSFLAGWALATVVGVIPYVSGFVFVLSAAFGIGALSVATWRARGSRPAGAPAGRHRAGSIRTVPPDAEAPGF